MQLYNRFKGLAVAALLVGGAPALADTIDLGFSIDGSGSINGSDFTLQTEGLAAAFANIPTSGDIEYRLAVTQFAGFGTTTIIEPTIVSAANIAGLQSAVQGTFQSGGGTPLAAGITSLVDLFAADGGLGDTTLLNLSTDGAPNSQSASTTAVADALAAGVDGISFEAVGLANISFLQTLARPGASGVVVTDLDAIPDPTTQGFVIDVASFDDFGAAIDAKIGEIVIGTGGGGDPSVAPIPLPAGLPLLLAGVLGLFGAGRLRRRAA